MSSTYQQLLELDQYATQTNVAPSFPYTGTLAHLERVAPTAAGRFRLRQAIDSLRTSMEKAGDKAHGAKHLPHPR